MLDTTVQSAIAGLVGKVCCRQRVGRMRSLSLGFGEKIFHENPRLVDSFYGEWEIGTYLAAWRVVQNGHILCGSQDVVDSLTELDQEISQIRFGRIAKIQLVSKFDIQVNFESGLYIDFLGAANEKDELFHIFCPNDLNVEYSIQDGWKINQRDSKYHTG